MTGARCSLRIQRGSVHACKRYFKRFVQNFRSKEQKIKRHEKKQVGKESRRNAALKGALPKIAPSHWGGGSGPSPSTWFSGVTRAVYAAAIVSVCPFVHLTQAGIVSKPLNTESRKHSQGLEFFDAKDLREIRPGSPPTGRQMQVGEVKSRRRSTNNRLYLENGTR